MGKPFDLGEALRPIVESLPEVLRPAFLAELEENAAARYRRWAEACAETRAAAGLRSCALRESEIARTVRALYPVEADGRSRFSDALLAAADLGRRAFGDRPLTEQFAIQAAAERRGASFWRTLAQEADDPGEQRALLRCAELEETSATFLEDLVRRGVE